MSGEVVATLCWQGSEVASASRVLIPADRWTRTGTVARTQVHFPGAPTPIRVDSIELRHPNGGGVMQTVELDGPLDLGLPDTDIDVELELDLGPVDVMAQWGR